MDRAKRTHKFKLGQSVSLQSTMFNRDAARGAYKVTKKLPERDGDIEYQIKRPGEPHERVVTLARNDAARLLPYECRVPAFWALEKAHAIRRHGVRHRCR
jgi:hypothetical protein